MPISMPIASSAQHLLHHLDGSLDVLQTDLVVRDHANAAHEGYCQDAMSFEGCYSAFRGMGGIHSEHDNI